LAIKLPKITTTSSRLTNYSKNKKGARFLKQCMLLIISIIIISVSVALVQGRIQGRDDYSPPPWERKLYDN